MTRPTREQADSGPHRAAALLLAAARVDPTLRVAAEQVQDALIARDAEVRALRAELEAGRDDDGTWKAGFDKGWRAHELTAAALAARTPQPADEIEQRFAYLANLDPGWDSYGAREIDPSAIATARSALAALATPAFICGTVEGGIQLTWDDEHVTLEINPGGLSASVGELYAEPEAAPLPAGRGRGGSMMLVEFILARLDEDERDAEDVHLVTCEQVAYSIPFPCDCGYPARVLADVAAKRRIVELHRCIEEEDGLTPDSWDCDHCGQPWRAGSCLTLRLVALPYVGHPDYRQEWKP